MKPTITAIMIAKNEQHHIDAWIKNLTWCDALLIIDDNSTDNTTTQAKKYGAMVINHSLNADYAAQRNFALSKVKTEWAFFVDGDEQVLPGLADEIRKNIENNTDIQAYAVKRIDHLFGATLRHGDIGDTTLVRLAKKNAGVWKGKVHETWNVQGNIATLEHPLEHYPHQTIDDFLSEINTYSSLRAEELYQQKIHTNYFYILAYPIGKFLEDYIFRKGFLDGEVGLLIALFMSFHSFLVRGKLWLLWHKK